MLRNFLKIAYRNLFKYKYYTLINIVSFSIGLTAYIFAGIYAANEHSYDRSHSKAERIFRIVNVYEKDSTLNKYAANPFPLAKSLVKEYPDLIEQAVRLFNFQNNFHLVEYHNKHFNEKNFFYTDSNITKVFDFHFIIGSQDSALQKANTVIISKSVKEKYFGEYNPLGKSIVIDEVLTVVVTGVFDDFPDQSHFHPEILTSITSLTSFMKEPDNWLWNSCWTYILLKEKVKPDEIESKFPDFVLQYFDPAVKDFSSVYLQAITDIHLNSDLESEIEPNNKYLYINILMIVSFFLLIVSWLNFINLSFVGSITRIKEVSIRKILGSTRRSILIQFITESLLASLIALIFALFLIEIFIPGFNFLTNENFLISRSVFDQIYLKMLLIALISGILVGIYTGFFSSLFPTFNLGRFKHKLSSKKWLGGKILIMLQYIISLIILIVVLVNFRQLLYFRNSDLGFKKENTLIMPIFNTPVSDNYEDFKSDLLKIPGIYSVTAIDHIIGADRSYRRYFYEVGGTRRAQFFPELIVSDDFIKTLGIQLLAGSDFRNLFPYTGDEEGEIIINESMVKHLNYTKNEAALRKRLGTFKGNEKIVGVIKNFSSRSLHSPVSPLVIRLNSNNSSEDMKYLLIKLNTEKNDISIKLIEKVWRNRALNRPFEIHYLDDILDFQYKNEALLNSFLWIFSILTIIISCLGIWAVTSLLSIQRTKEIGIRKALGASVSEILILFINDFVNILIISNLIAWPVAWLILDKWFKNFTNHISIDLLDFIAASLVILLLTLGIVIKHALKVAGSNSIDSLRDE